MPRTRYTYRPMNYASEDVDHSTLLNRKSHTQYVKKGNDADPEHDMDTAMVEDMLIILKDNQHERIRDLTGEVKSNYETFISLTRCLRGTEAYNTLYAMVHECFKNETDAVPGTILAYLQGCMIKNDPIEGELIGCSVTCAEGLQPPDDQNYKCQHKVIISTNDDDGYNFKLVQDAETNRAIIYIPDCNCGNDFRGFTDSECSALNKLGVDEIKLRGICQNTGSHVEITNGFAKCNLIKPRIDVHQNSNSDSVNNNTGLIIVLIILVLIILFIGWRILCRQEEYRNNY